MDEEACQGKSFCIMVAMSRLEHEYKAQLNGRGGGSRSRVAEQGSHGSITLV